MKRLTFSMPLFSIVPASIGVLMLWGFLAIFNALRFTQCPAWVLLQPPPAQPVALLGAPINRLYIQTENKSVYCLKRGQWSKCALLPADLQPDMAPAWLIDNFSSAFQQNNLLQVIRSNTNSFFEVSYYSLLADQRVYTCSTNIEIEMENILSSGMFVWLLIPLSGLAWSIITFVNLFIKHGQPTLWDFWGRGQRIK
jgi:hypothetical protein